MTIVFVRYLFWARWKSSENENEKMSAAEDENRRWRELLLKFILE